MKHRLLSLLLSVALVSVISSFVLAKPTTEETFIKEIPSSLIPFHLRVPSLAIKPIQFSLWKQMVGLDPVRFMMRASKDSVKLGEEFEITIKAELLPIPPSAFFVFDEQKSFSLKLILPEGFVQTGGDYYDYIGATLTTPNQPIQYTIKGFLSRSDISPSFMLLRGPKDGNASSIFEKKGEIVIKQILSSEIASQTLDKNASNIDSLKCTLRPEHITFLKDTVSNQSLIQINGQSKYTYSYDNIIYKSLESLTKPKNGSLYIRENDNPSCTVTFDFHTTESPQKNTAARVATTTNCNSTLPNPQLSINGPIYLCQGSSTTIWLNNKNDYCQTGWTLSAFNITVDEILTSDGKIDHVNITNNSPSGYGYAVLEFFGLGCGECGEIRSQSTIIEVFSKTVPPTPSVWSTCASSNTMTISSSSCVGYPRWYKNGNFYTGGTESITVPTSDGATYTANCENDCGVGGMSSGIQFDACTCADKGAWWAYDGVEECIGTEKRQRQRDVNSCSSTHNQTRWITIISPINAPGSPQIRASSGQFCAGQGGVSLSVDTQYNTYQWSNGSTSPDIYVQSGGTYWVKVGYSNECGVAWSNESYFTVTERHAPEAPSTPSIGGPTSFCNGQSVTLNTGHGYSDYQWKKDGNVIGGNSHELHNVNSGGTYEVRRGASNECGLSWSNAASVWVSVNYPPGVPVTPTITTSGATEFCNGGNVTLYANGGHSQYRWNTGSTSSNITVSGTGSYSVEGAISNECGTTWSNAASTYVNVISLPNPPSTPSITGPSSVCNGSTFSLETGGGYSNYEWRKDGNVIGYGSTLGNLNAGGEYKVRRGYSNSCGISWSPETSFYVTILYAPNAPPTPTINVSGATTFCQGGSVTLSSATTHNLYEWSNGSTAQSIFVNTGGNYQLRVADVNQCGTTWSAQASRSVTVHPIPSLTVSGSNPTTCNGTEGTITLQGLVANTAYTVNYSKNSGSLTSATLTSNGSGSITIAGLTKGSYTGIQVSLNGCSSSSGSINLTDPSPAAPTLSASSTSICVGASTNLTATNTSGATYTWSVSPSSGATLGASTTNVNTLSASAAGSYTVTVTQTVVGCSASASRTISILKPNFTLSSVAPTTCISSDGNFTLEGLTPNTSHVINYLKNTTPVSTTVTSNASGSITIGSLTAGNYTQITATQNGCISDPKSISLYPAQVTGVSSISPATSATCVGNSLSLSVTNVSGATYVWSVSPSSGATLGSPNANATSFVANVAGTYTVTVTQTINGCSSSTSRTISASKPSFSLASVNPATCNGTGSITLSGLTANTTYGISYVKNGGSAITANLQANNGGQLILSGLTAGNYTAITATLGGCTSNAASAVLADPVVPAISGITASATTVCEGTTVNLSVTNVAGATYTWSVPTAGATLGNSSAASNTLEVASAGSYVVTVTQTLQGCTSSATVTITCNARPNFNFTNTNPTTCQGQNGSIKLTGLLPSVSYAVSYVKNESTFPTTANYTANGSGQILISGLGAGVYVLQTSHGSCVSVQKSTTLSDPTSTPIGAVSGPALACTGSSIELNVASQPGASYLWSVTPSSAGATLVNISSATNHLTTSAVGDYTVNVIQAYNNCITATSHLVSVSETPSFSVSATNPTGCNTNDGSITLSGLVPFRNYLIQYGYSVGQGGSTSSTAPTTQVYTANASGQIKLNNLAPGNYSNITAGVGVCISTAASISLVEPTTTISAVTIAGNTLACTSTPISLSVVSVPGATYSWKVQPSTGASLSSNGGYTNTLIASVVDTYSVSVTQTVNGCKDSTTSASITFRTCSSNVPKFASTSSLSDQSICFGQTFQPVVAEVENKNQLVNYQWEVIGAFFNFQPIPGQTSSTLTALPTSVGVHEYRIKIINPYDSTFVSQVVKLTVKAIPGFPIVGATRTFVCAGDSSVLNASGCTGGSIIWIPNNGIVNGNQMIVRPTATTVYRVACNLDGCISDSTQKVTISVNPQSPPIPNVAHTVITICDTVGSTTLTASGCGTGSDAYAWYSSATSTSILATTASFTTPVLSQPTTYYVACKATSACQGVRVAIDVIVNPKYPAPTLTATKTQICPDSSFTLSISGCNTKFNTRFWFSSNSNGTGANIISNLQNTRTLTYNDLQADTTFFQVFCGLSCLQGKISNTITIVKKASCCIQPELAPLASQIVCQGASFQAVTAQITNNIPVTWQWYNDNGAANANTNLIVGQTTSTLTALPTTPGVYKYRVVARGMGSIAGDNCFSIQTVTLTIHEGTAPTVTASKLNLCPGESVTLTATGCTMTSEEQLPTLTKVRVFPRDVDRVTAHTGAYIEGSQDMVNWSVLAGPLATLAAGWNDITINNATPYRYLRYVGAPAGHGEIAEIEFYAGAQKLSGTLFSDGRIWANAYADYDFKNAFDGNTQSIWISQNAGPGAYIGMDVSSGSLVTWSNGLGSGNSVTFYPNQSGTYFATCNVGGCISPVSNAVIINVAASKPTPIITTTQTTICEGTAVTLSASGCASSTISSGGVLTKVSLYPQDAFYELNVGHRIQGSNDRISWTDLREPLPLLNPGWNHFNISTSTNYRYLRLLAGPNSYGALMELEFYSGSTKLSGTVFSDGLFWDANTAHNGANNAFDGNTQTQWYGAVRGQQSTFVGIDTQSGGSLLWSLGGQNTSSITVSPSSTTTYTATCNIDGCIGTATQAITVVSAPVLTDIPNQKICANSSFQPVQTSVTNGIGVTWQWYAENGSTSTLLPDQTTATLTQLPTTAGVYHYKVIATPIGGNTNCTTVKRVSLTIMSGIVITKQLPSSISICTNGSVTFGILAKGEGLTYQWQKKPSSGGEFTDVMGADSSALVLANVPLSENTMRYQCIITDACGNTLVSNITTIIIISPVSWVPTVTGGSFKCVSNPIVTIRLNSLSATEYNINFNAAAEANGFVDTGWQPITTQDTIYIPVPTQLANITGTLNVGFSVQLKAGTCLSRSSSGSFTFWSTPSLQLVSGYPICDPSLTTYTARVSVSSGVPTATLGTVSNLGSNVYQIAGIPINKSTTVKVESTCSRQITIDPPSCTCPTVAVPSLQGSSNVTICQGQTLPTFTVNTESGKSYHWYAAATGGIPLLANSASFSPTFAGTYYVEAQLPGTPCHSTRVPVTLTINPTPWLAQGSVSCQTLTYGLPIEVSTGATLTASQGTISGASPYYYLTGVTRGTTVTLTATAQGCSTTTVLPVTTCGGCVNPALTAIPAQEICLGASFNPVTTSVTNGVAVTYQWYNDNGTDNANTNAISGQTSASLTALPTTAGVYQYKVVATNTATNTCVGSQTVTLTIRPLPWIYLGGPSCFANTYDIAVIISDGATLATTKGNIVGIAPNHAVFNIPKGTAVTLTASAHGCSVTTVLADTICGGCVKPVLASIPSQTICQGDTLTPVTASITNGVAASLQWYNDNGTANPTTTALNGQTAATLTALPTTAGVYKYKLVAFNGVCRDSQTVTLTIKPMPWIYLGGPSCFATYYDIATVISEGATLTTSHGNIVGIAPNHAVFNIIKGTTVTLTATHNGCTTTTVLPASICGGCVIPQLAAIPSQTICQGDTLDPVGSSITNGVSARLQWFNDNGAANPTTDSLSGQNTPILTALPTTPGVYKYKLVATNTTYASCVGTQTVTITINETATAPTISFAASRSVVCPDSSVTLTASGCATTVNWHYTRANGSTATLAATEASVTVAYNTIAGTPTDSLTFRATCAGTCAATLYSNALLVVKKALCDTATVVSDSACYVYIKASNAQGQETTSLPRLSGALQPLKLQADDLDSTGFWNTGVTYLWTRPDSTTTTTDTLVASTIGAYKLLVSKQGRTCEAYVTLNAKPCVVRDYTSASCQTVTITNPTATNQLSSLAPGDVFYAADYSIHVTEASGGAGGWSGKGYVEVLLPLGVTSTVAVTFSGIAINDCYELTNGTVETEYDPNAGGILDVDDALAALNDIKEQLGSWLESFRGEPTQIEKLQKTILPLLKPYKDDSRVAATIEKFKNLSNVCDTTLSAACKSAIAEAHAAYDSLQSFIDELPPFPTYLLPGASTAVNGRMAAEGPDANIITIAALDACANAKCSNSADPVRRYWGQVHAPWYEFWSVTSNGQKYYVMRTYESLVDVVYYYVAYGEKQYKIFKPARGTTAADAFADAASNLVFNIGVMIATGGAASATETVVLNVSDAFISALEESKDGNFDDFKKSFATNLLFSSLDFAEAAAPVLKNFYNKVKPNLSSFNQVARNKLNTLRTQTGWIAQVDAYKNTIPARVLPNYSKVLKGTLGAAFRGLSAVGAKIDHKNKQILDAAGNTIATFQGKVLKFTDKVIPQGWIKKKLLSQTDVEVIIDGVPVRKKTDVDVWTCPTYVAPRGRVSAESDCILLKEAAEVLDLLSFLKYPQVTTSVLQEAITNANFRKMLEADKRLVQSWEILHLAGRNGLKKDKAILTKLANVLELNPVPLNLGFDQFKIIFERYDILGRAGTTITDESGVVNTLGKSLSTGDFLDFVSEYGRDNTKNLLPVMNEMWNNTSKKFIGAEWVLRYAKKNWSNITAFESNTVLNGVTRRIDIVLSGGKRLELKSWSTFSPTYYDGMADEFVKDLKQINDLEDMKWLFDGKGSFVQNGALNYDYLKTAVKQALQQNIEMLKTIPAAKANQLFDGGFTEADKTGMANAIISYFDNMSNFKKVFFIE